jgi:hypothetical protein
MGGSLEDAEVVPQNSPFFQGFAKEFGRRSMPSKLAEIDL